MKKIFENAVWWSGVMAVGLVLGISLQFVQAWTEPSGTPPTGNVGAPINTSVFPQIKAGVLGVVSLVTNSFQMATGAGPGKVFTSDALGVATWQPAMGGWYAPSDIKQTASFDLTGGLPKWHDWLQANGYSGYHACTFNEMAAYAELHGWNSLSSLRGVFFTGTFSSGMVVGPTDGSPNSIAVDGIGYMYKWNGTTGTFLEPGSSAPILACQ